jgi:hypothetical protein
MSAAADCATLLRESALTPCVQAFCADLTATPEYHQICEDGTFKPIMSVGCYSPVLDTWTYTSVRTIVSDCMAKALAEPESRWTLRECACCCSARFGAAVNTPLGYKALESVTKGEQVLALDDPAALANGNATWSPTPVAFTGATGADAAAPRVAVTHGEDDATLSVTGDTLVMTAGAKLKTASRLVPGDRLVRADGTMTPVTRVARSGFATEARHVAATDLAFTGGLAGHLLDAEGVIVGDYVLQLHARTLPAEALIDDHWSLPEIGSDAYTAAYPHLRMPAQSVALADSNPA